MGRQTSAWWGMRQNHLPGGATAAAFSNKKVHYYKHRIFYLTGTCYNFELEEFLAWFRVTRVCQRQLGILVNGWESVQVFIPGPGRLDLTHIYMLRKCKWLCINRRCANPVISNLLWVSLLPL